MKIKSRNYQEVLHSINYPTECLIIDFETYFDQEYSLRKMSTIEYIRHRMFNFLGVGYQLLNTAVGDLQPTFHGGPEAVYETIGALQSSCGVNFDAVTVVVQNAKFDATVLQTKFGIEPEYIIDIVDLARHYDARMKHDLNNLAKMFRLKAKGDTQQFKGLYYGEMDTETQNKFKNYTLNDVSLESSLFKILLSMVTNPTIELLLARHTLELYLKPRIQFDFQKAKELISKMEKKVDEIVSATLLSKEELSGTLSFAKILNDWLCCWHNEQLPVKVGKPTKNMIKLTGPGIIPALAQQDDGMKKLLGHKDEFVRKICQARLAIKSWPLHIKRIKNMINQARVENGKLRVPLHYYGGHTGRWSGGEKINLQNLGGRGRIGAGIDPLIAEMRSLLYTSEMFAISDASQIEARILAWLAGQEDLLEDFRQGRNPYCTLATKLFKEKVHKPTDKEKATPEGKKMAVKYGFGKDGILGCGYGMGALKFYQRCRENPGLRPLFDSGEYDFNFIEKLITTYRITYSRIPAFWKTIEKMFKWVIKYPHEHRYYVPRFKKSDNFNRAIDLGDANPRLLHCLWNQNGTVYLQLPSGRCLIYRHCRIKDKTIHWHWGTLWGGSITENIVQAIARDLLGYWILEYEKAGFSVVLHSHDEIISIVSKNDVKALDDMIDIMSQGPHWAAGLPLAAEGELSKVYKK